MGRADEIYAEYAEYIGTVYRMELKKQKLHGIYISREDEEDIYQRILIKIIRYLPRFDERKSNIKTYLYNIVKTQLRWILIDMRGMEGRPMSREAWENSYLHYEDEGFMEPMYQPDDMQAAYDRLDSTQACFAKLVMAGTPVPEAMAKVGIRPEESATFLDNIRRALTE